MTSNNESNTKKPINELLLDKHVNFIAFYGKTHDVYVRKLDLYLDYYEKKQN